MRRLLGQIRCRRAIPKIARFSRATARKRPRNGLLCDIFSQNAAWARSNDNIQPINRNQRVYGYGYSQSGFDVQTHVDAVLPLAKQENGKPIFDGFLIASGFNSPAPINQCASAPSGSGAGQIKNAGVPIIRMASDSEILLAFVQAGRRADSDQAQDRFREYEVAGTAHASQNELNFGPNYLDILAAGAPEQYVGKVIDDTRKLVLQRYITREDGEEIISHARNSDVPTLADIPSDIPDDLH